MLRCAINDGCGAFTYKPASEGCYIYEGECNPEECAVDDAGETFSKPDPGSEGPYEPNRALGQRPVVGQPWLVGFHAPACEYRLHVGGNAVITGEPHSYVGMFDDHFDFYEVTAWETGPVVLTLACEESDASAAPTLHHHVVTFSCEVPSQDHSSIDVGPAALRSDGWTAVSVTLRDSAGRVCYDFPMDIEFSKNADVQGGAANDWFRHYDNSNGRAEVNVNAAPGLLPSWVYVQDTLGWGYVKVDVTIEGVEVWDFRLQARVDLPAAADDENAACPEIDRCLHDTLCHTADRSHTICTKCTAEYQGSGTSACLPVCPTGALPDFHGDLDPDAKRDHLGRFDCSQHGRCTIDYEAAADGAYCTCTAPYTGEDCATVGDTNIFVPVEGHVNILAPPCVPLDVELSGGSATDGEFHVVKVAPGRTGRWQNAPDGVLQVPMIVQQIETVFGDDGESEILDLVWESDLGTPLAATSALGFTTIEEGGVVRRSFAVDNDEVVSELQVYSDETNYDYSALYVKGVPFGPGVKVDFDQVGSAVVAPVLVDHFKGALAPTYFDASCVRSGDNLQMVVHGLDGVVAQPLDIVSARGMVETIALPHDEPHTHSFPAGVTKTVFTVDLPDTTYPGWELAVSLEGLVKKGDAVTVYADTGKDAGAFCVNGRIPHMQLNGGAASFHFNDRLSSPLVRTRFVSIQPRHYTFLDRTDPADTALETFADAIDDGATVTMFDVVSAIGVHHYDPVPGLRFDFGASVADLLAPNNLKKSTNVDGSRDPVGGVHFKGDGIEALLAGGDFHSDFVVVFEDDRGNVIWKTDLRGEAFDGTDLVVPIDEECAGLVPESRTLTLVVISDVAGDEPLAVTFHAADTSLPLEKVTGTSFSGALYSINEGRRFVIDLGEGATSSALGDPSVMNGVVTIISTPTDRSERERLGLCGAAGMLKAVSGVGADARALHLCDGELVPRSWTVMVYANEVDSAFAPVRFAASYSKIRHVTNVAPGQVVHGVMNVGTAGLEQANPFYSVRVSAEDVARHSRLEISIFSIPTGPDQEVNYPVITVGRYPEGTEVPDMAWSPCDPAEAATSLACVPLYHEGEDANYDDVEYDTPGRCVVRIEDCDLSAGLFYFKVGFGDDGAVNSPYPYTLEARVIAPSAVTVGVPFIGAVLEATDAQQGDLLYADLNVPAPTATEYWRLRATVRHGEGVPNGLSVTGERGVPPGCCSSPSDSLTSLGATSVDTKEKEIVFNLPCDASGRWFFRVRRNGDIDDYQNPRDYVLVLELEAVHVGNVLAVEAGVGEDGAFHEIWDVDAAASRHADSSHLYHDKADTSAHENHDVNVLQVDVSQEDIDAGRDLVFDQYRGGKSGGSDPAAPWGVLRAYQLVCNGIHPSPPHPYMKEAGGWSADGIYSNDDLRAYNVGVIPNCELQAGSYYFFFKKTSAVGKPSSTLAKVYFVEPPAVAPLSLDKPHTVSFNMRSAGDVWTGAPWAPHYYYVDISSLPDNFNGVVAIYLYGSSWTSGSTNEIDDSGALDISAHLGADPTPDRERFCKSSDIGDSRRSHLRRDFWTHYDSWKTHLDSPNKPGVVGFYGCELKGHDGVTVRVGLENWDTPSFRAEYTIVARAIEPQEVSVGVPFTVRTEADVPQTYLVTVPEVPAGSRLKVESDFDPSHLLFALSSVDVENLLPFPTQRNNERGSGPCFPGQSKMREWQDRDQCTPIGGRTFAVTFFKGRPVGSNDENINTDAYDVVVLVNQPVVVELPANKPVKSVFAPKDRQDAVHRFIVPGKDLAGKRYRVVVQNVEHGRISVSKEYAPKCLHDDYENDMRSVGPDAHDAVLGSVGIAHFPFTHPLRAEWTDVHCSEEDLAIVVTPEIVNNDLYRAWDLTYEISVETFEPPAETTSWNELHAEHFDFTAWGDEEFPVADAPRVTRWYKLEWPDLRGFDSVTVTLDVAGFHVRQQLLTTGLASWRHGAVECPGGQVVMHKTGNADSAVQRFSSEQWWTHVADANPEGLPLVFQVDLEYAPEEDVHSGWVNVTFETFKYNPEMITPNGEPLLLSWAHPEFWTENDLTEVGKFLNGDNPSITPKLNGEDNGRGPVFVLYVDLDEYPKVATGDARLDLVVRAFEMNVEFAVVYGELTNDMRHFKNQNYKHFDPADGAHVLGLDFGRCSGHPCEETGGRVYFYLDVLLDVDLNRADLVVSLTYTEAVSVAEWDTPTMFTIPAHHTAVHVLLPTADTDSPYSIVVENEAWGAGLKVQEVRSPGSNERTDLPAFCFDYPSAGDGSAIGARARHVFHSCDLEPTFNARLVVRRDPLAANFTHGADFVVTLVTAKAFEVDTNEQHGMVALPPLEASVAEATYNTVWGDVAAGWRTAVFWMVDAEADDKVVPGCGETDTESFFKQFGPCDLHDSLADSFGRVRVWTPPFRYGGLGDDDYNGSPDAQLVQTDTIVAGINSTVHLGPLAFLPELVYHAIVVPVDTEGQYLMLRSNVTGVKVTVYVDVPCQSEMHKDADFHHTVELADDVPYMFGRHGVAGEFKGCGGRLVAPASEAYYLVVEHDAPVELDIDFWTPLAVVAGGPYEVDTADALIFTPAPETSRVVVTVEADVCAYAEDPYVIAELVFVLSDGTCETGGSERVDGMAERDLTRGRVTFELFRRDHEPGRDPLLKHFRAGSPIHIFLDQSILATAFVTIEEYGPKEVIDIMPDTWWRRPEGDTEQKTFRLVLPPGSSLSKMFVARNSIDEDVAEDGYFDTHAPLNLVVKSSYLASIGSLTGPAHDKIVSYSLGSAGCSPRTEQFFATIDSGDFIFYVQDAASIARVPWVDGTASVELMVGPDWTYAEVDFPALGPFQYFEVSVDNRRGWDLTSGSANVQAYFRATGRQRLGEVCLVDSDYGTLTTSLGDGVWSSATDLTRRRTLHNNGDEALGHCGNSGPIVFQFARTANSVLQGYDDAGVFYKSLYKRVVLTVAIKEVRPISLHLNEALTVAMAYNAPTILEINLPAVVNAAREANTPTVLFDLYVGGTFPSNDFPSQALQVTKHLGTPRYLCNVDDLSLGGWNSFGKNVASVFGAELATAFETGESLFLTIWNTEANVYTDPGNRLLTAKLDAVRRFENKDAYPFAVDGVVGDTMRVGGELTVYAFAPPTTGYLSFDFVAEVGGDAMHLDASAAVVGAVGHESGSGRGCGEFTRHFAYFENAAGHLAVAHKSPSLVEINFSEATATPLPASDEPQFFKVFVPSDAFGRFHIAVVNHGDDESPFHYSWEHVYPSAACGDNKVHGNTIVAIGQGSGIVDPAVCAQKVLYIAVEANPQRSCDAVLQTQFTPDRDHYVEVPLGDSVALSYSDEEIAVEISGTPASGSFIELILVDDGPGAGAQLEWLQTPCAYRTDLTLPPAAQHVTGDDGIHGKARTMRMPVCTDSGFEKVRAVVDFNSKPPRALLPKPAMLFTRSVTPEFLRDGATTVELRPFDGVSTYTFKIDGHGWEIVLGSGGADVGVDVTFGHSPCPYNRMQDNSHPPHHCVLFGDTTCRYSDDGSDLTYGEETWVTIETVSYAGAREFSLHLHKSTGCAAPPPLDFCGTMAGVLPVADWQAADRAAEGLYNRMVAAEDVGFGSVDADFCNGRSDPCKAALKEYACSAYFKACGPNNSLLPTCMSVCTDILTECGHDLWLDGDWDFLSCAAGDVLCNRRGAAKQPGPDAFTPATKDDEDKKDKVDPTALYVFIFLVLLIIVGVVAFQLYKKMNEGAAGAAGKGDAEAAAPKELESEDEFAGKGPEGMTRGLASDSIESNDEADEEEGSTEPESTASS